MSAVSASGVKSSEHPDSTLMRSKFEKATKCQEARAEHEGADRGFISAASLKMLLTC